MKRRTIIILILILAISQIACNNANQAQVQNSSSDEDEAQDKVYKLALSIPVAAAPYWAGVGYGVKKAVEEINNAAGKEVLEYQFFDPGTFELETQLRNIEDSISLGFDGMVIAPVDADGTVPAIEKAYDEGLPIFTVDVSANTDAILAGYCTYNYEAGRTYAEQFADFIKKKNGDYIGKVAMNLGYSNISSHIARVNGFKDTLKERYPNIEIIFEQFSSGPTEDVNVIENALAMHGKDIDGIFVTGDSAANSACKAIDNANLFFPVGDPKHIIVVGFDGEKSGIDNIRNGRQDATIAQNPIDMGYLSTKSLFDYLTMGTLPQVDNNNLVEVPHLAINADNVDSEEAADFLWSEIVDDSF